MPDTDAIVYQIVCRLPRLQPEPFTSEHETGSVGVLGAGPQERVSSMANQIQAGTMMVEQSAVLRSLGIESESYYRQWRSLGPLESSGLDHKLRAAGCNFFFMAEQLRAVVPAWGGQKTIGRGLKRLLAQTRFQHFNCMEVSHILKRRFFSIPYVAITAHARHMQVSNSIRSSEQRAEDDSTGLSEHTT